MRVVYLTFLETDCLYCVFFKNKYYAHHTTREIAIAFSQRQAKAKQEITNNKGD